MQKFAYGASIIQSMTLVIKSNFGRLTLCFCLWRGTFSHMMVDRPCYQPFYIQKHNQKTKMNPPMELREDISSSFHFLFYSLKLWLALQLLSERFMCDLGQIFQYQLTNFLFTYLLLFKLVLFSLKQREREKKRNIKLNHTTGILKEYCFYLLCPWYHILAFNAELYSLFKCQILRTVVILQGLSFKIRCIKLELWLNINIKNYYSKLRFYILHEE